MNNDNSNNNSNTHLTFPRSSNVSRGFHSLALIRVLSLNKILLTDITVEWRRRSRPAGKKTQ